MKIYIDDHHIEIVVGFIVTTNAVVRDLYASFIKRRMIKSGNVTYTAHQLYIIVKYHFISNFIFACYIYDLYNLFLKWFYVRDLL